MRLLDCLKSYLLLCYNWGFFFFPTNKCDNTHNEWGNFYVCAVYFDDWNMKTSAFQMVSFSKLRCLLYSFSLPLVEAVFCSEMRCLHNFLWHLSVNVSVYCIQWSHHVIIWMCFHFHRCVCKPSHSLGLAYFSGSNRMNINVLILWKQEKKECVQMSWWTKWHQLDLPFCSWLFIG